MSLYPNIEYGLSTDEEILIEEEEYVASPPKVTSTLSPGRLSKHMRPLSKYDHRPRNVEFDGRSFVPSRRRQSHRAKGDKKEESVLTHIEFTEDKVHMGHRREWFSPNEVWRMDMCRVIALGCLLGLLLGIGYRGGFSGLYLGLFYKGIKSCTYLICSCHFHSTDNLLKCPSESFDQVSNG